MNTERRIAILEKAASYQVGRGQGYGHLRAQGYDVSKARSAVAAYYQGRGSKKPKHTLFAGDRFSRGKGGELIFQRGKHRMNAYADKANRQYTVSRGSGANEQLLDSGGMYPMKGKPAPSAVAKVVKPAPAAGGRLPQRTDAQSRKFDTYAQKLRGPRSGAPLAAVAGRLAGRTANAGKIDAGIKPVSPGPSNLGSTNIVGGPAGVVKPPVASPPQHTIMKPPTRVVGSE